MTLEDKDIRAAQELRHKLHAYPEVSGEEFQTAQIMATALHLTKPDHIIGDLGGHGLAVIYEAKEPGETLLFRAELDALPIQETTEVSYQSTLEGKGHLCGHDGHMAILYLVARHLGKCRPKSGKVILFFQPAEEDGSGAAAVLADLDFKEKIKPDYCFALHNMPGIELGNVALADGPASCASRGMRIALHGATAHASMPHTGRSPMLALSSLMPKLTDLGSNGPIDDDFCMVTVTHVKMGEPVYGIAPGDAELRITLRALNDPQMDKLIEKAEALILAEALAHDLSVTYEYDDIFHACKNHPKTALFLREAMNALSIKHSAEGQPMLASEDFGRFSGLAPSAMFLLGAGTNHPNLHNSDYDFPDDLLPIGAAIFLKTIANILD